MADKPNMQLSDPDQVKIEAISEDGSRRVVPGTLGFFGAKSLMLIVGRPLPPNYALSVEQGDILFVGEVRWCRPEGPDSFQVCMHVEHTLSALQSLTRMRDQLLGIEQAGYRREGPAELRTESAVALLC